MKWEHQLGLKENRHEDRYLSVTNQDNHSLTDILTVLIGSLCDKSIRTSAHFRVSRHIDRVSGVLFEIGQNYRLIGEIRMRQVDHSGNCINLDTRVVDGVV